jgi:hypothetical protein
MWMECQHDRSMEDLTTKALNPVDPENQSGTIDCDPTLRFEGDDLELVTGNRSDDLEEEAENVSSQSSERSDRSPEMETIYEE